MYKRYGSYKAYYKFMFFFKKTDGKMSKSSVKMHQKMIEYICYLRGTCLFLIVVFRTSETFISIDISMLSFICKVFSNVILQKYSLITNNTIMTVSILIGVGCPYSPLWLNCVFTCGPIFN